MKTLISILILVAVWLGSAYAALAILGLLESGSQLFTDDYFAGIGTVLMLVLCGGLQQIGALIMLTYGVEGIRRNIWALPLLSLSMVLTWAGAMDIGPLSVFISLVSSSLLAIAITIARIYELWESATTKTIVTVARVSGLFTLLTYTSLIFFQSHIFAHSAIILYAILILLITASQDRTTGGNKPLEVINKKGSKPISGSPKQRLDIQLPKNPNLVADAKNPRDRDLG